MALAQPVRLSHFPVSEELQLPDPPETAQPCSSVILVGCVAFIPTNKAQISMIRAWGLRGFCVWGRGMHREAGSLCFLAGKVAGG